jgi:hypothetical protein
MTATTFSPFVHTAPARTRPSVRPGLAASRPMPEAVASGPGWIERLALWADAHPPVHHRMGAWTLHR